LACFAKNGYLPEDVSRAVTYKTNLGKLNRHSFNIIEQHGYETAKGTLS
jgi:hypothetical protein